MARQGLSITPHLPTYKTVHDDRNMTLLKPTGSQKPPKTPKTPPKPPHDGFWGCLGTVLGWFWLVFCVFWCVLGPVGFNTRRHPQRYRGWQRLWSGLSRRSRQCPAWVPEGSLAGNFWVGFPGIFGQTWPQDPSRSPGLALQFNLHEKSAPQTNSKAIS